MNDALTLYKLIILYMLNKVDLPLTNSQLSQFIIGKGYTDYFTIQTAINELIESRLISYETIRNTSHYELTPDGIETLNLFEYKISAPIKEDILSFFNENKYQLRKEVEIIAEYFPESETEYLVRCAVKERTSTLMEIKLNVVTKEQAITICDNWKNNSSSVYESLLQQLMFDSSKQNQSTTQ